MNRSVSIPAALVIVCLTVSSAVGVGPDQGAARKLVNSQGCKACHALEGDGGILAGSFEEMREKLSRQEIREKLVSPTGRHGNEAIPDFSHLSNAEIDTLVKFIQPEP